MTTPNNPMPLSGPCGTSQEPRFSRPAHGEAGRHRDADWPTEPLDAETLPVRELAMAAVATRPLPTVGPGAPHLEQTRPTRTAAQTARHRQSAKSRPWPLLIILLTQSLLSLRLITANTAFEDEALYLWAGHLEWAHWLHGVRTPLFPTYFSGAPVIYPPIGALADSAGGLIGARIMSLCFMLGATVLLWCTARNLYGPRAALFAAGMWAVLGPTQRLGAFATFDPVALFFVAVAAWCATVARNRRDATKWLFAGACAMVLANATKYATALLDPVIVGLALLSGYPPGGKHAMRRAAYLLAVSIAAIIALVEISPGGYVAGIDDTTLARRSGEVAASLVLRSSWDWTGAALVGASLALAISFRTERPAGRWLLALLASSALLVPIEQARIHTYTSLSKHVDFGAWFAAIAAGYAADRTARWLRMQRLRVTVGGMLLIPLALSGAAQANSYFAWPGVANLLPVMRKLTAHGGRFLADNVPTLEYYLPRTSWRQWSNVYSITLPSGRRESIPGNDFRPYKARLAAHYFRLVVLAFTDKPQVDSAIAKYLSTDKNYTFVGRVPFANPRATGSYLIWKYRGAK